MEQKLERMDKSSSEELFAGSEDLVEENLEQNILTDIEPSLREKLKDIPGAFEYIEKLEKMIEKQIKKIIKWKKKARKKRPEMVDVSVQVDMGCIASINSDITEPSIANGKSIVDDIKEAADMAVKTSGFVYEETSGMYYDYNTGYYYNAEYGLYYNGNTGTYLKYNQETNTYDFHSQVSTEQSAGAPDLSKSKSKRRNNMNKAKDSKRLRCNDDVKISEFEEGECSKSSSSLSSDDDSSDSGDASKQWPPCMRVIVEKSEDPNIKLGSLHIITCDGGSVGREGHHSIILNDINVSKHHLKIYFDKETGKYMAIDLGSRNGTILNGKRMSPSKQESSPMQLTHSSKIQIGTTVLLCHIHKGSQTCGHCEPGLLVQEKKEVMKDSASMTEKHKKELKKLKKQHGLLGYNDNGETSLAVGYTDRAQKRRETIGSQNPYEKTESSSIDTSIASNNKGFKLLLKMGWKEGESLGKDGEGLLEPVKPVQNEGTSGLGSENSIKTVTLQNNTQDIWKKARDRFDKLPDTNNVGD